MNVLSQEKYQDPNPVVRYVLRRFFARIRALVAEAGPRTVLDSGCGEGEVQRRGVMGPDACVFSLDLKLEALDALSPHSAGAWMVAGTVLDLPFASGSVDLVLCLEVLEHLEDPGRAVREAARVARHRVIFSVPWEPWFRAGNLLRGKYVSGWGNFPEHIWHWNFSSFSALLAKRYARARLVEAFPWMIAVCDSPDRLPGIP